MVKYIIKRLLLLIPVLLGVATIVFLIMRVFLTDPSQTILGKSASDEQRLEWRQKQGLEEPLHKQYFIFLQDFVKGNLGKSYATNASVVTEIFSRFPATIELAISGIVLALIFGVSLGIISAIKRNSIFDSLGMTIALVGVSVPIFWLGVLFIIVFSNSFIPSVGRIDVLLKPTNITGFYLLDSLLCGKLDSFFDALKHLILPSCALAMYSMAVIARMTRSSMLETLSQDYVRTARAKGLPEKKVIFFHALRNALIPIVTVVGLQFGSLLAGAVLTESIFSWPGIGKYTVECIQNSDIPVVQGMVLILATIFVFVNLAVDIIYAFLDPRIKFSKRGC
ncbi:MAG: ABC transporter permease [Oscillospiraceae bacterium]|jgi:peptide/nickel transport system permease protein|nr:ABC transporter permease [Oscillospiraceae bacterium]